MRFASLTESLYPRQREEPPEVTLLYGPSGCGKTRQVFDTESLDDLWVKPADDNMWFDGYDNHPAALLDDFAGRLSKVSLVSLLRMLDRYVVQFPVKGGFVYFAPQRIWITTNIHPSEWYEWTGREAQYPALRRRFTRVVAWGADGTQHRQYNRGDEDWDLFWVSSVRGAIANDLWPNAFDRFI